MKLSLTVLFCDKNKYAFKNLGIFSTLLKLYVILMTTYFRFLWTFYLDIIIIVVVFVVGGGI